jgi:hypothetical protein
MDLTDEPKKGYTPKEIARSLLKIRNLDAKMVYLLHIVLSAYTVIVL